MKKQHKETQLFRHDAERDHPCSNRAIPLTNFDQLRGRQTLCVGFEPPVTAVLIVGYNGWKGFDTGCLGEKVAVLGRFEPGNGRGRARLLTACRLSISALPGAPFYEETNR